VCDRCRPPFPIGPRREECRRPPVGAGDDRLAQARGRIRHNGLGDQVLLHELVFPRGNAAKSVARRGPSLGGSCRDLGDAAQDCARNADDAVAALDVPTLGGAGPQICDSGIRVGDCHAHDVSRLVFYDRAAGKVDQDVETESLQWTQRVAAWQCDHGCFEYTVASRRLILSAQ